jgi:hypothetical protein
MIDDWLGGLVNSVDWTELIFYGRMLIWGREMLEMFMEVPREAIKYS